MICVVIFDIVSLELSRLDVVEATSKQRRRLELSPKLLFVLKAGRAKLGPQYWNLEGGSCTSNQLYSAINIFCGWYVLSSSDDVLGLGPCRRPANEHRAIADPTTDVKIHANSGDGAL